MTPSELGTGWAFFGKIAAVREGSGKPLPWPFGPHAAGYKIQEYTHSAVLCGAVLPGPCVSCRWWQQLRGV